MMPPRMGGPPPHSMPNHPGMMPMANTMSSSMPRNPGPNIGAGLGQGPPFLNGNFDGKRMRNKTILRKTVDYNTSITNYIEVRMRHKRKVQGFMSGFNFVLTILYS